jgi:predicted MFS family arabinose efflux permease
VIKEPLNGAVEHSIQPWNEYWRQLLASSRRLKVLIAAQLLTGFSLMALPFYVVYAREELGAPSGAVGWFLLAQISGGVLSNLVWARLVDRSGSRRMLFFCAIISTLTPLLAIGLSTFGWMALLPVFFFAGAVVNGRSVGFQSALLELAPAAERPTYAGLNAVLLLPVAFLSLGAGMFLQHWPYWALFVLAAIFIGAGAALIYHWSKATRL